MFLFDILPLTKSESQALNENPYLFDNILILNLAKLMILISWNYNERLKLKIKYYWRLNVLKKEKLEISLQDKLHFVCIQNYENISCFSSQDENFDIKRIDKMSAIKEYTRDLVGSASLDKNV